MSEHYDGAGAGATRRHWPLAGIVLAFVLLALIYSLQTPPFEGPDEPQHYAYIAWLAEGKGFPPQGEAAWETPIEQEAGQPPLYYLLAAVPASLIDLQDPPAVYRPNPHFTGPAPRTIFDNDNRAIHYPADGQPLRGGWLALRLARWLTIAFGALLVIAVYALARQVQPQRPGLAYAAAFLVAFTPQVLYISAVASNDIPAAALSTLALVFLAVLARRGPEASWALPLATGICAGLAGLAKINALVLIAPVALALFWMWRWGGASARQVLRMALLMAAGGVAVSGWWFARITLLYGSPLGVSTHDYTSWAISDPEEVVTPLARWLEVGRYYWIALGWGTIRPPDWVYSLFFVAGLAALVGLLWQAWRARHDRRLLATRTAAILMLFATMILANALFLEIWMRRVIAPYGRLLFPSIGAITILLLLGWRAIHPRLPLIPLGFVAVLAAATPFLIIGPAYTAPVLSAEEEAALPAVWGWRFGDPGEEPFMELISVQPEQTSVSNKDILTVEVCWRVLAQAADDYTVMLQIIGPQDRLVAQRRSYPGQGRLPTSQWQPGTVFCDQMLIRLKAEWADTLVYRLELAVLDETTDRRLRVVDTQGQQVESTFVGPVRVVNAAAAGPTMTPEPGSAPVLLVDHEFTGHEAEPGQTLELILRWAATMPLAKDYQVFLHLRDRDTGEVAVQADGPPVDGWYPTSWWTTGEVVTDKRRLPLRADLPSGAYDLVVGMYDLDTLEQLGPEYHLGTLQVTP